MWNRLSNIAQNVQTGLDTVVDNVNKSMTEEEAAAAEAMSAAGVSLLLLCILAGKVFEMHTKVVCGIAYRS